MQNFKFEDVAKEMTMIDTGGEAGRQLDITEARQGLSAFLRVAARYLTLVDVAGLMADHLTQTETGSLDALVKAGRKEAQ